MSDVSDVMEFGKFKGRPLREVPQSYLEWLIATYARHLKEWKAEIDRRASDHEGNERRLIVKPIVKPTGKRLDIDDLPPWEGEDEFATVRVHPRRVKTRGQQASGSRAGHRRRRQVWRQVRGNVQ